LLYLLLYKSDYSRVGMQIHLNHWVGYKFWTWKNHERSRTIIISTAKIAKCASHVSAKIPWDCPLVHPETALPERSMHLRRSENLMAWGFRDGSRL